jgi:hypothetical protein
VLPKGEAPLANLMKMVDAEPLLDDLTALLNCRKYL